MTMQRHFGDPCIHCGTPLDDVEPGACKGDATRAKPIAYRSMGVRWDGIERFLVRLSTGAVQERHHHISEHAPYRHFSMLGEIQSPLRYDPKITAR
jgi:hypothetical protein